MSGLSKKKPEKLPEDVIFILSIVSAKENQFPNISTMKITVEGKKLPQVPMLNADKQKLSDEDKRNNLNSL